MNADYQTPPCCDRPSIAVMDYKWPVFGEATEIKVNRVCLHCYAHWAGVVGSVVQYTRKEWNALMDKTFSEGEV